MTQDTYRAECHFDGCDAQFIGIDRDDYVEHIREEHGELPARIWDEMVVPEHDWREE